MLSGTAAETLDRGQSGDGYVNFPSGKGDSIEWVVVAAEAGDHSLGIGYVLLSGDRPLTITVNGQEIGTESCPVTGSWAKWGEAKARVTPKAGTNTVRLTSAKDDGPNIDYLTVTADG